MAHRSRFIGAGATALAAGLLVALPSFSSGATVKNDLRSFTPAQTRVGPADPAETKPPLHGTNPHGQGTAAVVDLTPNADRPFTVDETGSASDEDIVVGRSRGEQRANGTYHGHVTVAALFGNEIIAGADTQAGDAPVDRAIADTLLDELCTATRICIEVAHVRSNTTTFGSFNSFTLAGLALGGANPVPGVPGATPSLRLGAAESVGNIFSDGTCQTADGSSRVVDLAAGTAVAKVAESASQSGACRGAAPTQANSSRVIELGGTGVPLPAAGCANGTPDTVTGLPVLLPVVCNADDASSTSPAGNQAAAPYGVRHALDVYVLAVTGVSSLAQVSAAQSESRAVAPAAVTTPTTPTTTTPTTTTPTTTTPITTTTPGTGTGTTPGTAEDGGTAANDGAGAGDDDGDAAGNEGAGDDGAGAGTPECSDGVDNDGDGKIDFGSDPDCTSAEDDSEAGNAVNLGGKELPFTGTDVVVLGLAGSLLLAAGLTLSGPARRRELDL